MDDSLSPPLKECLAFILEKLPNVIGIYLFGSFGTVYERPESDIDLAIFSTTCIDGVVLWDCAQEISLKVGKTVEMIDLRKASTVFRYQIIGKGKRIFCSDPAVCDRIENTYLSMYLRFNEERKELLEERKRYG